MTIPNIASMSLGSPSHEGSVTSPRSPASGYGDHQSLMSSPQSGPVHYEMPTAHNNHPEQVIYEKKIIWHMRVRIFFTVGKFYLFFRWISTSLLSLKLPLRHRLILIRQTLLTSSIRQIRLMSTSSFQRSTEVNLWVISNGFQPTRSGEILQKSTKTKDSLQFLAFLEYQAKWPFFDLEVTWGLPSLCFLDLNLDFIFRYKIDLASKPADPIIILSRQDFEWGHKVQYFGSKIFWVIFLISGQQANV